MKTKVKMLKSVPVSPDGLRVENWEKGKEYQADDDLLQALIGMGAVELSEAKSEGAAPENKALGAAPKRKRTKRSAK
jgi:hypothetical protein